MRHISPRLLFEHLLAACWEFFRWKLISFRFFEVEAKDEFKDRLETLGTATSFVSVWEERCILFRRIRCRKDGLEKQGPKAGFEILPPRQGNFKMTTRRAAPAPSKILNAPVYFSQFFKKWWVWLLIGNFQHVDVLFRSLVGPICLI